MSVGVFLEKADENLRAARLLLADQNPDSACNRAYYSMHDAARAALFVIGREEEAHAKTHTGLISLFNLHLIKPGLLSSVSGKSLSDAAQNRIVADYDGIFLSIEVVQSIVENATHFLAEVTGFVQSRQ